MRGSGYRQTLTSQCRCAALAVAVSLAFICPLFSLAQDADEQDTLGARAAREQRIEAARRALEQMATAEPASSDWLDTAVPAGALLALILLWAWWINRQLRLKAATIRDERENRERIETALRDSQRTFTNLMGNLPGMVYSCRNDPQRTMEFVSEGCRDLTGFHPGALVGNREISYAQIIHPEDRDAIRQGIQVAVQRRSAFQLAYRVWTRDGTQKWVSEQGRGVFNKFGELQCLEGFISDITQRKRAEENLRRSEKNLQITLDAIGDGVIATDAQVRITRMNPVAETLTGWHKEDALGSKLEDVFTIVDEETRKAVENPVRRVLAGSPPANLTAQTLLVAKDKRERRIADSVAPIHDQGNNIIGAVLVFRDVTEEQMLQEQLRQAQKMKAFGQLAGGIAHDFNNLLGAIVGYAELLRMDLGDQPEHVQHIEAILNTASTAANITGQLLAFARKGKMQTVPVDVQGVITKVVDILTHTIDPRIEIVTQLSEKSLTAMGDPARLQNAILNLGLNARDAMAEGGKLTFSIREVSVNRSMADQFAQNTYEVKPGPHVTITVADTGIGMDQKTVERVFEPFFTTKSTGKGTGMGLAAVYGTMKAHRGAIDVRSQPGKGSQFTLYLPLVAPESAARVQLAPVAIDDDSVERGSGHILFVDDDKNIRRMGAKLIEALGYTVALGSDGEEAVAYFEKNVEKIDLVILDMMMPKMNGRDAFLKIREIDPSAKILLCTGYTMSKDIDPLLENGALGVIQKPFRQSVFSRRIASAITG